MKNPLLLTIGLVIVVAFGCAQDDFESPEAREFIRKDADAAGVIAAVRGYNKALIRTYANNDISPLREYAGEMELSKVEHLVNGFRSQKLRMEAELLSLRIEKIARGDSNTVQVSTLEQWRYRRLFEQTQMEQKSLTNIEYNMQYTVKRIDGTTWKVYHLTTLR